MTFSEKTYIKALVPLAALLAVYLLVTIVSFYFSFRNTSKYGVMVIFLFGFFWYPLNIKIVNWIESLSSSMMDKKIKDAKSARLGYEGENMVNAWLEDIAGKENIIRNIQFKDCDFDIDLVAVGSKGVFVFEVKNLTDTVYFENNDYFYQDKNGKKLLSSYEDPRSELRRHANSLKNYLNDNGFGSVKINMIVAFASGKADWNGKSGIYIAKNKESLRSYISKLGPDPKCTVEVCEKIKTLLKKNSVA